MTSKNNNLYTAIYKEEQRRKLGQKLDNLRKEYGKYERGEIKPDEFINVIVNVLIF